MKKYLEIIGVVFLLVILFLSLTVFYFCLVDLFIIKAEPGKIGPIGDTFGGLLSPIIGSVSIYFIYKTFEAQREQLEDQKLINKATIGSIYLSELKDWISDIHNSVDGLVYGPTLTSHRGRYALEEFATNFDRNGQWTNLDSVLFSDLDFLDDALTITNKLVSIAEFVDLSKNTINNQSHELLWRRLSNLSSFLLPLLINVYRAFL